ncbi:50S ribosomal protein L6 [Candidatus Woesearchaeota archaeon]|nr:50S ribosomal protein L6 [Candidatus Woesearchaeota archaeon]
MSTNQQGKQGDVQTSGKKQKAIIEKVPFPQGVTAQADHGSLRIQGPKGTLERAFRYPAVEIKVEGQEVVIQATKKPTMREKKMVRTFQSHIKNMVLGVQTGYIYKLKICSGHFPMNVAVANNEFVVKNFLGEKYPRKIGIRKGTEVKVEGDTVTVTALDKELAGQMAANIERLTNIQGRDRRIFQDGIYIITKNEKVI